MIRFVTFAVVAACMAPYAHAQADGDDRGNTTGIRGAISDIEPDNDSIGGAPTIDFNGRSTAVGVLFLDPAESDYVRVNLALNETVAVFAVPLGDLTRGFGTPDTILAAITPGGTTVVSDDDSGSTFPNITTRRGSTLRFSANSAGTSGLWSIRVSGFSAGQTGPYALVVTKVEQSEYTESGNGTFAAANVVAARYVGPLNGTVFTGTADDDYFAIDLEAGDVLVAAATSIRGLPAAHNDPNMTMRLIAPDQSSILVSSFDDDGGIWPPGGSQAGGSTNPTIFARASTSGRHYLLLEPVGSTPIADACRLVTWVLPASLCPGDADGSGTVAFLDITTVLANFGNSCP
jgi:hypothetical protein